MNAFVRARYTGPPTRLGSYGFLKTGTEVSISWRDWQYMEDHNKDGQPDNFEKLGESDVSEDLVHPDVALDIPVESESIGKEGGDDGVPIRLVEGDEEDEEELTQEVGGTESLKLVEEKEDGETDNSESEQSEEKTDVIAEDSEEQTVDSYDELTVAQLKEQLSLR